MERNRWLPNTVKGEYIAVNIPDFKLFYFNNNEIKWSTNVIVGQNSTSTVIFNDTLKYIVFSPYWNIPKSIIKNEIIPEMLKNQNYIESHFMEIIGKSGNTISPYAINWKKYENNEFPYLIRQKPGNRNSLGLVKFIFPNSHSIYMHDTPAKSLFGETNRAFSHGCIRVENPKKLASLLLEKNKIWNETKINDAMQAGKEKIVVLKNQIPVFITYFTSWVDSKGKLNFRKDIYKHDEKMKEILFNNETF